MRASCWEISRLVVSINDSLVCCQESCLSVTFRRYSVGRHGLQSVARLLLSHLTAGEAMEAGRDTPNDLIELGSVAVAPIQVTAPILSLQGRPQYLARLAYGAGLAVLGGGFRWRVAGYGCWFSR